MATVIQRGPGRIVVFGDRECWTKYVIVRRDRLIAYIREARKAGVSLHSIYPEAICNSELGAEHYSGPGMPFARPVQLHARNRRFHVWAQSGGLDV